MTGRGNPEALARHRQQQADGTYARQNLAQDRAERRRAARLIRAMVAEGLFPIEDDLQSATRVVKVLES